MKLSNKPTAYLLVKADTDSEWDTCEFAIAHITEEWKRKQAKRLELVQPLKEDDRFQAINFYDAAVGFYRVGKNGEPDIDGLLAGKEWAFVELESNELEAFAIPENRLDCYRLSIRANGTAYYTAYGKHTNEEFWTEDFLLQQITEQPCYT